MDLERLKINTIKWSCDFLTPTWEKCTTFQNLRRCTYAAE